MKIFGEPWGGLGNVDKAVLDHRGLRVQTHDLVAGRLVASDTVAAIGDQLLDQLGARSLVLVKYTENEVWIMEKNKSYWAKELPYLDGIEFYHVLPFSPEMASAILAKRFDYVFATDPATFRKATTTQGMSTETH